MAPSEMYFTWKIFFAGAGAGAYAGSDVGAGVGADWGAGADSDAGTAGPPSVLASCSAGGGCRAPNRTAQIKTPQRHPGVLPPSLSIPFSTRARHPALHPSPPP